MCENDFLALLLMHCIAILFNVFWYALMDKKLVHHYGSILKINSGHWLSTLSCLLDNCTFPFVKCVFMNFSYSATEEFIFHSLISKKSFYINGYAIVYIGSIFFQCNICLLLVHTCILFLYIWWWRIFLPWYSQITPTLLFLLLTSGFQIT